MAAAEPKASSWTADGAKVTVVHEPPAMGERRHLTALFCDLVDSTPLAQSLDPEDFHEVIDDYLQMAERLIARHEGYIANFSGDGLLIYFGYPKASEDDAPRAVRAGLELLTELARLNDRLERRRGVRLSARIGIHTGEVVAPRDRPAAGLTLHFAARLQTAAAPNTVVVSGATLELIRGLFVTEDLGARSLKGVAEPVAVHHVLRPTGARTRLEARGAGLLPLIGRDHELATLVAHWEDARLGPGRAILVGGDPGIGKSRLVKAFRDHLGASSHTWLECRCSSYTQQSSFHPVIEMQRQVLGFAEDDTAEDRLAKLERRLADAGFVLADVVPTLGALHSLPLPPAYSLPNLSPEGQRRRMLDTLCEWLVRLGRAQPVVLFVDDLQWADPSTLELLGNVVERLAETNALVICTHRPTFAPPWQDGPYLTHLALPRLTAAAAVQMIRAAAAGESLPDRLVQEITRKTDGIPLFVEEMTKAVVTGKEVGESGLAVPATLQELLGARLDGLGPVKELAQVCAVLGREFGQDLVGGVSRLDDEALGRGMSQLVAADLLLREGEPPAVTYQFKHVLFQEAAYRSLLKSQRQRHHRIAGEVLAAKFPALSEAQPEVLAYHFTQAGEVDAAIGYWLQAGQRAVLRSANVEAVSHMEHALALIETVPDLATRVQLELHARVQQAMALIATRGYGSDEAQRTFARARELCQAVGETPQLFPVLFGLWLYYLVRSEPRPAGELSEQLLRFASAVGDPSLLLEAHGAMAATAYWRGDHLAAREHAAESLALYDRDRDGYHAFLYGQDPAVFAHFYHGLSAWFLGYPDQALASVERGLALAEEVGHPFTLAVVLLLANDLRYRRREPGEDRRLAERVLALATEQHFVLQIAGAMTALGWCRVVEGEVPEGIAQLRESTAMVAATGANINGPFLRSKLVEAYRTAGMVREGLEAVDAALEMSGRALDRHWEAELFRQRGELLLLGGSPPAAAERCFEQALEIARAQQARSLELRAATSRSALWQAQGRSEAAYDSLAGVYAWFTEGFDTADLREARALLERIRAET